MAVINPNSGGFFTGSGQSGTPRGNDVQDL